MEYLGTRATTYDALVDINLLCEVVVDCRHIVGKGWRGEGKKDVVRGDWTRRGRGGAW